MSIYLLPPEPIFPPVDEAEEDGLLAIGGDFSVDRLLNAYASGIFPWFVHEGDIFWYSPDPRMVLFPGKLKVTRSLQRVINSGKFEIRFDHDFESVIRGCAGVSRSHEPDTWISEEFITGFTELHRKGFAHSVETYFNGELAGGLYGVSLGRAFFGESMFFSRPDASKVALVHLVERITEWGFSFIDCQVDTEHFRKLGAEMIRRENYMELLNQAIKHPTKRGSWKLDAGQLET